MLHLEHVLTVRGALLSALKGRARPGALAGMTGGRDARRRWRQRRTLCGGVRLAVGSALRAARRAPRKRETSARQAVPPPLPAGVQLAVEALRQPATRRRQEDARDTAAQLTLALR